MSKLIILITALLLLGFGNPQSNAQSADTNPLLEAGMVHNQGPEEKLRAGEGNMNTLLTVAKEYEYLLGESGDTRLLPQEMSLVLLDYKVLVITWGGRISIKVSAEDYPMLSLIALPVPSN